MTQFIAVPVGQGDAFYLKRDGFSVLVDGGRSRLNFHSMFTSTVGVDSVDVLVCTHNDADHANGILGFLESGLKCNEIWLPGRWLGGLPDLLKSPIGLYLQLRDEIWRARLERRQNDDDELLPTPLETYATPIDGPVSENEQQEDQLSESGWPDACRSLLEEMPEWNEWPLDRFDLSEFSDWPRCGDKPQCELLWSAISAAERIRQIAILAFHAGVRVRWFEFTTQSVSRKVSVLMPLNAREVKHRRPYSGDLLRFLALTVSNRESLVFWSPPNATIHPGVLFTADSDLSGITLPSSSDLKGAIVTAPHHGSEANAAAYAAIGRGAVRDASSITWVRSDGQYRTRPGKTYLKSPGNRLCTLCRNSNNVPKSAVRLHAHNGKWTSSSRVCSCK
jgi:hypothetical protein